jgi:hypothetical protein
MNAFLIVIIVVAVFGIGLALTPQFSIPRLMSRIGRRGGTWIDHRDDIPIEERSTADELDDPIPVRPPRPRPRPR